VNVSIPFPKQHNGTEYGNGECINNSYTGANEGFKNTTALSQRLKAVYIP